MSTFIGQFIGFVVIVFLVVRYVVPPVRNMMRTQQDNVRQQLEDSSAAAEKVARADEKHADIVHALATNTTVQGRKRGWPLRLRIVTWAAPASTRCGNQRIGKR